MSVAPGVAVDVSVTHPGPVEVEQASSAREVVSWHVLALDGVGGVGAQSGLGT